MSSTQPCYSREQISQRGDTIWESDIRPSLKSDDDGKFVAIDVDNGSYEIDEDELTASDRLLARRQNAQIWLVRIGSRCVRRYGPRSRSETS